MASLLNGFGGPAGFGSNELHRNDDDSSAAIDITPIFENGLNFFGYTTTELYLNTNGSVTFSAPRSQYTPDVITETSNNPEITPFYADVDTRMAAGLIGSLAPTPGGTSMGTNQIYWHFDIANDRIIFTWDDVGYYNEQTNLLNAFQLILQDQGNGNFDIEFRYEDINWTTGDASGGTDGLGGEIARGGFTAGTGDPTQYFELPQSGDQNGILNLERSLGNTGESGRWVFEVRDGVVGPDVSINAVRADRAEGDDGATSFTFEVTRDGDLSSLLTLDYTVTGSGLNPATGDDFVSGGLETVTTSTEGTVPSTGDVLTLSLTVPDGTTARSVEAFGFIGNQNVPEPPINIAFIIDVSGSTSGLFRGDVDVGDRNGDGDDNTILDAEIAAFEAATERIAAAGFDAGVNVALIPFSTDAEIMLVTNPSSDGDGNGLSDIIDALRTLDDGGSTYYDRALEEAINFFSSQPEGDNFIYFLSDGAPNGDAYDGFVRTLIDPDLFDVEIRAIGVGSGASEQPLDLVDDDLDNDSAPIILDPDELADELTRAPIDPSQIDRVEFYLDGNLVATVYGDELVSTPLGLRYDVEIDNLSPDQANDLEVRLIASDADATTLSTSQTIEALDGADVMPSGTITFAPGEATRRLTINVDGDTVLEPDQGFTVTLGQNSAPVNFVQASASGLIRNDDRFGGEHIIGTPDQDILAGTIGHDTIEGLASDDAISGLDGYDSITGGAGNDTIDGGDSFDDLYYILEDGPNGVHVNLALGVATDSYGDTDVFFNMEGAFGTNHADQLYGDPNGSGILLSGMGGDDTIYSYSEFAIMEGGDGDDLMVALGGSAEIDGGADADYIVTSYGANTIDAGAGDDWIYLRYGTNAITLGDGYNLVLSNDLYEVSPGDYFADSSDTIFGGSLDDYIYAGRGRDSIDGGAGNDWIAGGEWADTLTGGAGYDRFIFGDEAGFDVITDFQADGEDFLDFTTSSLVSGFGDLTVQQIGSDLAVAWNGGASGVTLQNVAWADFTAADILV